MAFLKKLYMNKHLNILVLISSLTFIGCYKTDTNKSDNLRWSEEKIWNWYDNQPWLVGSNFITSSSINQLEFWQSETFDTILIEKELKLSASIGMILIVFIYMIYYGIKTLLVLWIELTSF